MSPTAAPYEEPKDPEYTADQVTVPEDPMIKELVVKLNTSSRWGQEDPKGSIMHYRELCEHDSGFMCECRLQHIIDFLKDRNTIKDSISRSLSEDPLV